MYSQSHNVVQTFPAFLLDGSIASPRQIVARVSYYVGDFRFYLFWEKESHCRVAESVEYGLSLSLSLALNSKAT